MDEVLRRVATIAGAVCLGLIQARPAAATSEASHARTPVHAPTQVLSLTKHRYAPAHPARAKARQGAANSARSASKLSAAAKSPAHVIHRAARAPGGLGVLVLAGCYGRFIGWRDQLSALMLQANSYTPWPDDKIRFDRMERAFAAGILKQRKLALSLQPAFKESDFPQDIREAFRAGLKASEAVFADGTYEHTQILVVGQPDLSPRERMSQLEANADQAFAPLADACERPTSG